MRLVTHLAILATPALIVCALAAACSDAKPKDKAGDAAADKTTSPPKGQPNLAAPIAPAAARKGTNPPSLYQNANGIFFEILELDSNPFDGKMAAYHDGDQKIVKEERQYASGRLQMQREYWPNAQLKTEILFAANGGTTNHFDQAGKPVVPVNTGGGTNLAQGRLMAWTTGGGQVPIERYYGNQPTSLLLRAFGPPDEITGNIWVYRGLNITDARTAQRKTSVRFAVGSYVTNIVVE